MTTVTLRPGAVVLDGRFAGDTSFPPHADSVIVGAPPQWADSSDSTYATIHSESADGYTGSDTMYAPLPTLADLGIAAASVIRATLNIRWSSTHVGAPVPGIQTLDGSVGTGPSVPVAVTTSISEVSCALDSGDPVATVLAGPDPIVTFFTGVFGSNLTVFELWIDLETSAPLASPRIGDEIQPPRRQYPRSDGLGLSSARRHWPRPGSIQASNRRAGGYL